MTGKIYQFSYGENGYDATKTVKVGGESAPVDVKRLVDRLNTCYENKILDENDEDNTELVFEEIKQAPVHKIRKISPEKRKLIDKIREKFPHAEIDETMDILKLRQQLQTLEAFEDDGEENPNEEQEDSEKEDVEKEEEVEEEDFFDFVFDEDDGDNAPDDDEMSYGE